VASDPTVSRLIDTLAASGEKALQAIRSARSEVRDRAWSLAGKNAPDADGQVVVDLDGVLVVAHSEKEDAAATWKKTYGHHPLTAFVDHGPGGTGEPVAALFRPGNAGSNTAADHITTAQLALAQLPKKYRRGRQTLIRTDSAGGTHDFVSWLARRGRGLSYSVGMTVTEAIHAHVLKVPASAWTPAVETDGEARDGAWVAELTGKLLDGWPKGMRLIVRKERPHPGAQLRLTDADGMRITCFATNTAGRSIAELELRHRLRARAEDRIRAARATGLRNLPLHRTAQNRIWLEIVQIALDLLAWMPMLALT
ncbi:IS1380 family transposase, partial [Streptomyces pratens]